MTVSYQYDVASSTSGGFTRLLFKWQGSLYKLIHHELILFCIAYGIMSALYRFAFNPHQKRVFEQVAFYCDTYMNYIPLSFILGFYVSFVASRWWQQYMAIPWPDKILHAIALYIGGKDDRGRMLRRSLVRYLNLSLVLVLRSISSAVKKRFPTIEHLVEAGFITEEELRLFNMIPNKEFNTYWIPCTWFTAFIKDAKSQKRLTDPVGLKLIMEEFCEFRQKCGMLWSYDWVSIPLVYTQVVTIATYSFFIAAIIGRQFVEKSPYRKMIDLYIPFFTLLQFFFYMGLLKVAEQLINPFGDDDEDFELNWIIDRHIKVSYLIVDTLMAEAPPLTKDMFFDEMSPELPYTEASATFKKKTFRGSVANMIIPEDKQNLILPDIIEEGEECEDEINSLRNQSRSSIRHSHLSLRLGGLSPNHVVESKDGRSLSVPEMQHPSLSMSRGSISRSSGPARSQGRRLGSAGSKGVSNALIVVGSNQAVMGADSSNAGERSVSETSDDQSFASKKDIKRFKSEEELDYLFFPFRDVCLDIEDSNFDSTDSLRRTKDRGVSWMPPSLQAKLAVKKKPVIKWKPYHRPVRSSSASTELERDQSEEAGPPGVFEDECAFMWRTIDDETESEKVATSYSVISEDSRSVLASQTIDSKVLSYYSEIKPKSLSRDTEDTFTSSQAKISQDLPKPSTKSPRVKRTRYKLKGRTRHFQSPLNNFYYSLPYIPNYSCGHKAFLSRYLRSLSEASIFLKALNSKTEELKGMKRAVLESDKSHKPSNYHCKPTYTGSLCDLNEIRTKQTSHTVRS